MIIYKITNLINGKSYIGKTIQTLKKRWNGHLYESFRSDYPFARAIKKYGRSNFSLQILAKPDCVEAMNLGEQAHILASKTLVPYGYNVALGGDGFSSEQASSVQLHRWKNMDPKTREQMTLKLREQAAYASSLASHPKGRVAWNKGKTGQIAWNKGLTGIFSAETLKKMSDAKKASPRPIDARTGRFVATQ